MNPALPPLSLADLRDKPQERVCLSPLSREACLAEGITLANLNYRPLDQFLASGLSPHLAKLKFDFYEAKRQDLIHNALNTRERIRRERATRRPQSSSSSHAPVLSDSSVMKSDERRWLNNVLKNKVKTLQQQNLAVSSRFGQGENAEPTNRNPLRLQISELKQQNKKIDVERQKRKNAYARLEFAARLDAKEKRTQQVLLEKKKAADSGRAAAEISRRARQALKDELFQMEVRSRIDHRRVARVVQEIVGDE